MSDEQSYEGSCFCGAVQFTVSGKPAGMGCCDCESCRRWSAIPVIAFTLWKPDAVQIIRGANSVATYSKKPWGHHKSCRTCGGNIFTEHPAGGLIQVYAAAIPAFPYRAHARVNYLQSKPHIESGLLQMKRLPKIAGQSSAGRTTFDAPAPPQ